MVLATASPSDSPFARLRERGAGGVRAATEGVRAATEGVRADDAPPILPNGPAFDEDMPTVPKVMPSPSGSPSIGGGGGLIVPLAKPAPKPSGPLIIPDSLGNDGTKHEFILPPLELLNESPPKPVKLESAVAEKQAVLMRTLTDFKIGANVSQVAIGPTVTRYEVQLEPGHPRQENRLARR